MKTDFQIKSLRFYFDSMYICTGENMIILQTEKYS